MESERGDYVEVSSEYLKEISNPFCKTVNGF